MVKKYIHRKNKTNKKSNPLIVGLVYANWCGHCQQLKPEWHNLKEMLMQNENADDIKIIEIEDSDSDKDAKLKSIHPNLVVNGYPTIFKYPYRNNIEYYGGNRDSKSMLSWCLGKKTVGGYQSFSLDSNSLSYKKSRKNSSTTKSNSKSKTKKMKNRNKNKRMQAI
jgi:thiol-disulfide isomerase/thioredoxin